MIYRNQELLRLAKDAPSCMACGKPNDGDIVAAHRNQGKGLGMKVSDAMVAYVCSRPCHYDLDQGRDMTRDERRAFWDGAFIKTIAWLFESGHLIVAPEAVIPDRKPKPRAPVRKGRKLQTGRKLQSRPMRTKL